MAELQMFSLVFPVNISPKVLFMLISTLEGLSRWYAERVVKKDETFVFEWEGSAQTATLVESKENEYVRFCWIDDFHKGHEMEFRISHEPVSGETALVISDYAEVDDLEVSQLWWTKQVGRLQRIFHN